MTDCHCVSVDTGISWSADQRATAQFRIGNSAQRAHQEAMGTTIVPVKGKKKPPIEEADLQVRCHRSNHSRALSAAAATY